MHTLLIVEITLQLRGWFLLFKINLFIKFEHKSILFLLVLFKSRILTKVFSDYEYLQQ